MCGRYTLTKPAQEVKKRFHLIPEMEASSYNPFYNGAPTQLLPVISNTDSSSLSYFRWGIIPSWAKEIGTASTFNARSESVLEKASFEKAFEQHPCLVIADGYYEWQTQGKNKLPFRITLNRGELFAMAGIWDKWITPQGEDLYSFSVLTVPANSKLSSIHERMPVILPVEREGDWLEEMSVEERKAFLQSAPSEWFDYYPVSSKVGNVRNNDVSLIQPIQRGTQGSLF
ncbi:SOS response-associated peptidase [Algivirga pacifica]|uniref:Abasic site processing protein n=1 Tax=Algivirga pacifica TaxID=1162670 RepID=A0ABP9DFJ8_9BACT